MNEFHSARKTFYVQGRYLFFLTLKVFGQQNCPNADPNDNKFWKPDKMVIAWDGN